MSGLSCTCTANAGGHEHPAGVGFYRLVDELTDVGKASDIVEARLDLGLAETQQGSVEEDVLAPVNSWLKPEPNSSSAAIRPRVSTRPSVGDSTPVTICSSVPLPLPFLPTMPTDSPFSSSSEIWRKAQKSWA